MTSYILMQTAEEELGEHLRFIVEQAGENWALGVLAKFEQVLCQSWFLLWPK